MKFQDLPAEIQREICQQADRLARDWVARHQFIWNPNLFASRLPKEINKLTRAYLKANKLYKPEFPRRRLQELRAEFEAQNKKGKL